MRFLSGERASLFFNLHKYTWCKISDQSYNGKYHILALRTDRWWTDKTTVSIGPTPLRCWSKEPQRIEPTNEKIFYIEANTSLKRNYLTFFYLTLYWQWLFWIFLEFLQDYQLTSYFPSICDGEKCSLFWLIPKLENCIHWVQKTSRL